MWNHGLCPQAPRAARLAIVFALALGVALPVAAQDEVRRGAVEGLQQTLAPQRAQDEVLRPPDVIFVPTPPLVVKAMLELAGVTAGDLVYDLGSGDGRIPIAAARDFGARAVGIDIDPARVREATENARAAGVADRVQFLNQDLFTTDISEATVVTLYLLPSLNERLLPKLNAELRPGTRVLSHEFPIGDFEPDQTIDVTGRRVLFWTIPIEIDVQGARRHRGAVPRGRPVQQSSRGGFPRQ